MRLSVSTVCSIQFQSLSPPVFSEFFADELSLFATRRYQGAVREESAGGETFFATAMCHREIAFHAYVVAGFPGSASHVAGTAGANVCWRLGSYATSLRLRRSHLHSHVVFRASASAVGGVGEQSGKSQTAVVLVDHGSRRPEANKMLDGVKEMVAPLVGRCPIYTAHMELAEPSIADAFDAAVADGAMHIVVVPFFLAPGRHVTQDIPDLSAAAAAKYEGITHVVRPPLGTHPSIAQVIVERANLSSARL